MNLLTGNSTILGRGLLAKALEKIDNGNFVFYANGLSNSVVNELPEKNFERNDLEMLSAHYSSKPIIYFSTVQCNSEGNFDREYVRHKLNMEKLIAERWDNYLIVRTSNLVGNNPWNTHTLFNYLYQALLSSSPINVDRSIVRNILDVDDFVTMLGTYLSSWEKKATAIEIVNPVSHTLGEILAVFEKVNDKKFQVQPLQMPVAIFNISEKKSIELAQLANINFENYLERVIRKYYTA